MHSCLLSSRPLLRCVALALAASLGACSTLAPPPVAAPAAAPAPVAPAQPVEPPAPPAIATPAPRAEVLPPAPVPAAPVALTPAPKTQPPHRGPALPLVKGYYLNVGLFAVPANGARAYQLLEDAGLPVFSDSVHHKKGLLTRVRVGPFLQKAQAQAAASKVHALKLDAVVFKL